ncbi:MAG TPA: MarR family winged helix-turn-helix transcriptional regulator [Mycobacteriales bacterium]|nr:MarR family winged helix-turn-helix transcriptional regulator [Mycobacteriales bacterium]
MARRVRPAASAEQRPLIGAGFLISALGAHASAEFAKRIWPLGLIPPHIGILHAIGAHPGRSQQAVADVFRLPPSRMVALIDDLEARGLVERRRDERDRRVHLLHLSAAGEAMLVELAAIARSAEKAMFAALTAAERRDLTAMLTRIADQQGLTPGVHPGYERIRSIVEPAQINGCGDQNG